MRALIVIDKVNWAYDTIAKAIKKYNTDSSLSIDILAIKSGASKIKKDYKKYDRVLVMGWQNYDVVNFLPKKMTIVGVHSYHSWDERKTTPEIDAVPSQSLIDNLNSFLAVNVVSQRLFNLFCNNGVHNLYCTQNGVDTDLFRSTNKVPVSNELIVGYSGTKSHDWRKGISEFIVPAAKKCNVSLKLAMLNSDSYIPVEEMSAFYNSIDCYICASSSEGMSLSVLEACACGRPVIGTRVSGNTEIINDGFNGYLVERKVEKFAEKINILKDRNILQTMGVKAEQDCYSKWSWGNRVNQWVDFIKCEPK